jgi:hypothetical protein
VSEAPQPRDAEQDATASEPPPVLGSWRRLYALVLIELLVTTAVLYLLARWAA